MLSHSLQADKKVACQVSLNCLNGATIQAGSPYASCKPPVLGVVLLSSYVSAVAVFLLLTAGVAYLLRNWAVIRKQQYLLGNLEIPDFANKPRPSMSGMAPVLTRASTAVITTIGSGERRRRRRRS